MGCNSKSGRLPAHSLTLVMYIEHRQHIGDHMLLFTCLCVSRCGVVHMSMFVSMRCCSHVYVCVDAVLFTWCLLLIINYIINVKS